MQAATFAPVVAQDLTGLSTADEFAKLLLTLLQLLDLCRDLLTLLPQAEPALAERRLLRQFVPQLVLPTAGATPGSRASSDTSRCRVSRNCWDTSAIDTRSPPAAKP